MGPCVNIGFWYFFSRISTLKWIVGIAEPKDLHHSTGWVAVPALGASTGWVANTSVPLTLNRAGSTLAGSSTHNSNLTSGVNKTGTGTLNSHNSGQATGGGSRIKKGWSLVTTEEGFFTGSTGTANVFETEAIHVLEQDPWIRQCFIFRYNSLAGSRIQPTEKVSVKLPVDDWLCRKMEKLNCTITEGYPSRNTETAGPLRDQFVKPPRSSRWYDKYTDKKDSDFPGLRNRQSWIVRSAGLQDVVCLLPHPPGLLARTFWDAGKEQQEDKL